MSVRLQRFLAQAGIATRRKAELLITEGRVRINGRVADQPGQTCDPDSDRITVDGRLVEPGELRYLLVCKPRGRVVQSTDPENRPLLRDLLPRELGPLHAVGRLEFNSEGAVVMTSDGALVESLHRSARTIPEIFHVKFRGEFPDSDLNRLRRGGLPLGGREVSPPCKVRRLAFTGKHSWIEVEVADTRPRLLQRCGEALEHTVLKIARLSYAGLEVGDLKPGEFRSLSPREVESLQAMARPGQPSRPADRAAEPSSRPARSSQRPDQPGRPPGKPSGRPGQPRGQAERPGGRPGQATRGTGQRTSRAGKGTGRTGHETGRAEQATPRTGQGRPRAGQPSGRAGHKSGGAGQRPRRPRD
jgi:23S rRNA pseudouridine2605 synthase